MSEPERQPLPAGTLLNKGMYCIEKLLGEGGFALTYLASQGRWNLSVCIKEFFPYACIRGENGLELDISTDDRIARGLQAFNDEGATLGRFKHPGIVRVLGSFSENNTAYLVQEVLDGMTLGDGQFFAGKMKQGTVLNVAQQLGQALLMVHAAGLVHSDLKPENIFLTREGRYVLLDFGLTRGFLSAAGAEKGARGLSEGFAPPEQYEMGTLGPATDVYGFAATLYALATGMAPPDAPARLQGQEIPSIKALNPSISSKVEKALLQALALDPLRRTPGVREFLHQLGLDSTPKAISYHPAPFEQRITQKAHSAGVTCLVLNLATRKLYSAGRDGVIKAWNWPDLRLLSTAHSHESPISALAVSQDGNYLVSGTDGGEIKLAPTHFSHPGVLLAQESAGVSCLQFHGEMVAASMVDGRCCLLGPSLSQPVSWVAHAGPTNSIAFHPDGFYLASAGDDGKIRFWELPEPRVFAELAGHSKGVQSIRFACDGTTLLSSSIDLTVKFWDLFSHEAVRDLFAHQAVVLDAQMGSLENFVVSLSGDHTLRGFHLSSARVAFSSEARNERPRALAVDPEHPFVATGGSDGSICVWEYSQEPGISQWKMASASDEAIGESYSAPDPWIGRRFGPYSLSEVLKVGGLATLYKAVSKESGQPVAVKVLRPECLSPEFSKRFGREIKVSMKLDHPNVVRTLDWGQQDNISYLVSEFVEGTPLSKKISRHGMPLQELAPILEQIVEGLGYAHGLGVVHRNLKPDNVMVREDGGVKLVDFGLARDQNVETLTKAGRAIGTPEYMAPEQVTRMPSRKELTDKTDQYALGVLIFEALSGRRPFEWDDPVKLIEMHVREIPPSLSQFCPDLPGAVEAVVARMLSKRAEDRFASVHEAGQAFKAALA